MSTPTTPSSGGVASWVDKLPADMTMEELQSAKEVVQAAFDASQAELGWKSLVNTALQSEIYDRFSMQNAPGYVSPGGLPPYPVDQVKTTFGG